MIYILVILRSHERRMRDFREKLNKIVREKRLAKFLTNEFLTNDKPVITAGGMIGSNIWFKQLYAGLTPNITFYDVFSAEGVAEEMCQLWFRRG